jgi:hypothetical protein
MGEIYTAYQTLNKMLNLGLTREQFMAAEAQFKLDFADRMKFPEALRKDPMQLMADWELTASLTPRRTAIRTATRQTLDQLTSSAVKQRAEIAPAVTRRTTKG